MKDNNAGVTCAALYIRVSSEEQKIHGLSVEAQSAALQTWATENPLEVIDLYNDAGISARKKFNKRPELLRLLEDVKAKKIDLIVFTKLDRCFRNIAEYYKVQEILEANNVNWKTIHEDYDTSTASGRLKINIMLSVAQDEADRDSERIKAVFASKLERGEPLTGQMPTGYIIKDKRIIKDPEKAEAIDAFFKAYLNLRSVTDARNTVKVQYGLELSFAIADNMLRKPAYYGTFHGIENFCPAYITKEQHEDIVANRRKRQDRRPGGERIYLFTGLLFCSECGHRMSARSHRWPRKGDEWTERTSYNCPGTYTQNICTNRVNIREYDIENFLLEEIDEALENYKAWADSCSASSAPSTTKDKAKVKHKLSKLKDLYINDLIELDTYRKDYATLKAKLEAIEAEEQAFETPPDTTRLTSLFVSGWQDLYKKLSMKERQNFWRISLSKIIIYADRTISFEFLQ